MNESLTSFAATRDAGAIALILLECSRAAASAASEHEALQVACDIFVRTGVFRGASIGFNQAGRHKDSRSNHCFPLIVDGDLLGALTVSSAEPGAFTPQLIAAMNDWADGFAPLVKAAQRRALHGRANAWQSAGSDLEDLKRTETALRRSEAFLAKAQQLSSTGSLGWIVSTGKVMWSDETFRIFGYERNDTTPTWEHVFQRVHDEDRPRARGMVEAASRDCEGFDAELRLVMPDRATKHIRIVVQAVGCPVTGEFVGAVMDTSANEEMLQALRFRDQVMGILGHDLRNPLCAVLGIAALARLSNELPARGLEQMAQVERAASRMQELVDTLLDFTQTRFAGRLPILPMATDLVELCRRVVGELTSAHPERTIDVTAHGNASGTWDPSRISQVVSNLVGNALTHGDSAAPVRVSIDGGERKVALNVHNLGSPIPEDQIATLFEPFRRGATAPASAPARGLGLGLHIAKQIVIAHGGTIGVRSCASDGTTFSVELPRHTLT